MATVLFLSDLVGIPENFFPFTRSGSFLVNKQIAFLPPIETDAENEPRHEKTNNVLSDQVRHIGLYSQRSRLEASNFEFHNRKKKSNFHIKSVILLPCKSLHTR